MDPRSDLIDCIPNPSTYFFSLYKIQCKLYTLYLPLHLHRMVTNEIESSWHASATLLADLSIISIEM